MQFDLKMYSVELIDLIYFLSILGCPTGEVRVSRI